MFGHYLKSDNKKEIYLGKLIKSYSFDVDPAIDRGEKVYDYDNMTTNYILTRLKNPVVVHMKIDNTACRNFSRVSDIIYYFATHPTAMPLLFEPEPEVASDALLVDITEQDFYSFITYRLYSSDILLRNYLLSYPNATIDTKNGLFYLLERRGFGLAEEPFELSAELIADITTAGFRYVEET
jgi:hypothetical protein